MSTRANRNEQARRRQEAASRQRRTQRIRAIVAGGVAVALAGGMGLAALGSLNTPRATTPPAGTPSVAPAAAPIVPQGANASGDALVVASGRDGTPTLTLYLDHQCPNCAVFEKEFGPLLADTARAGDWTLQHKTMTFMDDNLGNDSSTRAAIAAACAADHGQHGPFTDAVLARQAGRDGFPDAVLREEVPAQVGLRGDALAAFRACYDGRATAGFVATVNESALADGVKGTPTLAVDGTPVDLDAVDPFTPEGLKAYILANA
ncbi:MAG TPA: thioredoxin domain-containing protein [Propionibacterium sp.]|nr:thioredoxin domain-containing protein [Propionibacterium sp.]